MTIARFSNCLRLAAVLLLCLMPASVHAQQWVVSGTETLSNPGTPLPGSVNDPVMWLDASDISSLALSGNHISSWADLSGNGNAVSRGDLAAQPTIGINPATGHASVVFNGRDVLSNTFNVGTPYTIFTASSLAGSLNARLITTTSNNWLLGYWGGGENRMFAEGWVLGSGGPAATTNPHFYGATGSGSNTTFYDGVSQLASNANGVAAPNGISLGAWSNNPASEPSRGYVSELIIFDRVLSTSELGDLNSYLQAKWSGPGQVADNTEVIVNAGNTLALSNTAETIGSLAGDGAVTLDNAVLGLGAAGTSTTFSGTISGNGGIAKVGAGTQTLSGPNTYSGGTQVHQGTLDLGASGNVGSTTSLVNVGSHLGAGTLAISGGSLQASSITLGADGAGTLNISGGSVSANTNTGFGTLVIGQYHAGTVNQSGGTLNINSGYGILGRYAGSSATYNLSGGTLQTNGDRLYMAWDHASVSASLNVSGTGQAILNGTILEAAGFGTSAVNVSDNGLVDVINNHIVIGRRASGPATVNLSDNAIMRTSGGSGTRDIYIGWDQAGSQGTLNIQDNATLSIVQNFNAANQGTAIVNQSGGTTTVGGATNLANQNGPGSATLNLSGGSFTTNVDLNMARNHAGASAILNVSGGTLTINNGRLEATPRGTATVNHSGGTIDVVNSHIVIGRFAGGSATVNLSGNAIMQTSGGSGARDIYIAWDQAGSQGTLNIQDNATLSIVQNFNAANQGTAIVNQSGGTTTVGGSINLATQNSATGNATLNLSGGTFTTSGALNMATANAGAEASLNVAGGALSVAGALNAANQGTAAIAQSGGTTTITGATNLANANAPGNATLNVTGGTFNANGGTNMATANAGAEATLNLNGGLYSTSRINTGTGTATINFDGGTLRTTADHHHAATTHILAGGGTFDVAGTSTASLSQDLHGSGDLTKTGTGTLVLRDGHNHTGAVIIESGTIALASSSQPDLLFTFDSASGTTVANHGALPLNGNLALGATLTAGGTGRNGTEALAIANNTSQHLQVGTSGADHDTTYTVAGWFQDLHSGNWRTFSRGSGTDHHIIVENGSDRLGAFIGGFRDSGATLPAGQPADPGWAHIAVVADGATSTYYLNGVNVGSHNWVSNADVFAIGNIQQPGNFQPFASKIDDFYMFNHALTPAEVAQLASDTYAINHNTNILADDKPLAIANAGTLDLRGNNETIGSLIDSGSLGGGTVTNSLAATPATLTIGADNSNASFSGRLTGDLSLTKTGTGNQTLSGMSTYSGATQVAAGTLTLGPVNRASDAALFYNFETLANLGSAGPTFDGQLINGATIASGGGLNGGDALAISGGAQHLQPGSGSFNHGTTYTISAWFQDLHGTGTWRTLARGDGGNGHHVIVENGTNRLGLFTGAFRDGGSFLYPGNGDPTWHQITAVADGNSTTFYLDGVMVGSTPFVASPNVQSIGNFWGGGQPFAQRLDDFALFTRALSAEEVASYYRGDRLPFDTDLAIAAGATVDLSGGHQQVASLADLGGGGGTVTNNGATPATLGVVGPADTTFSGTLQNGNSPLGLGKGGDGTLTLTGNNSHTGGNTVAGGTLVSASNTALGGAGNSTDVTPGGTLGLQGGITVADHTISLSGQGAAGRAGALDNLAGDNTIAASSLVRAGIGATDFTVASSAGTLTIDADVHMRGADATFTGAGDTVVNGVISGSPLANLAASQDITVTADGQTFSARVDHDGTNSWLLIGRGREGWDFTTTGQGAVADVNSNLGTPAGFAPAAYSDAIVNDLLSQLGVNLDDAEVRIRRAANAAGTDWQEARWYDFASDSWTFDLNQGPANQDGGIPVTHEVVSGPGAPFLDTTSNTRDTATTVGSDSGNNAQRIFTWPWSGHNFEQGFSYGSAISGGANNATSYLWQFSTENHAIPYSEVYIRPLDPATNHVTKDGPGTLTLTGANTYSGGTTVAAGTLLVNNTTGSGTGSGPVAVEDGATLGGNGTIAGATVIAAGGTLSPGNSAGTLTFNSNLTLDPGATLFSDVLFGGSATDLVVVHGDVSLGGAILDGTWGGDSGNIFAGTYSVDNMFWLIQNEGGNDIDGRFANTTLAPGFAGLFDGVTPYLTTIDGQLFAAFYESQFGNFSQQGLTGGNDFLLMSIPEPSRALLLAVACAGLLLRRRRG